MHRALGRRGHPQGGNEKGSSQQTEDYEVHRATTHRKQPGARLGKKQPEHEGGEDTDRKKDRTDPELIEGHEYDREDHDEQDYRDRPLGEQVPTTSRPQVHDGRKR